MIPLRFATASQEIPLGQFVDSTDGDTEEEALTINASNIALWKAGATSLVAKNSGGATHMADGIYVATLDATDTNTLGSLVIFVHVSGALPIRLECCVYPAEVYDTLFAGTDRLTVDLSADAQLAVTGAVPSVTEISTGVLAAAEADPVHANVKEVSDDTTAADDLETLIESGAWATAADLATVDGVVDAIKAKTDGLPADTATALTTIAGYLDTEIAAILAAVDTEVAAIKAKTDLLPADPAGVSDLPTDYATAADLATVAGYIDTEVAAIKAKTDNLPADPAATSDVPTAAAVADAVWDEALAGHTTAGTGGKALADALAAVDTEVASIVSSLATLATAVEAIDNYIDTEVAAIKAKTDLLPASPAATGDVPTADDVRDAVWSKAMAELADVPGVTGTALEALEWLFLLARNRMTQSAGTSTLRNDANDADIATATVSDDGTMFVRGEWS